MCPIFDIVVDHDSKCITESKVTEYSMLVLKMANILMLGISQTLRHFLGLYTLRSHEGQASHM